MTLYEIDNNIRLFIDNMLNSVDENGEVKNIEPEELEQLQAEREKKLENIACYIKNLNAEVAAIKAEETNLKARREAAEKKAQRLKKLLAESLIASGDKTFKTGKVDVSFRKSTAVVIPNEDLIQIEYLIEDIKYKPDRAAIKRALNEGKEVQGAFLEERQNIQIN